MDLTFNSRMEAYYQKFIELQEKLRNSEEERLKLEMKFNDMVQATKEEEQLHYKKLRSQYKRFLDEDRKRQERNERIIRTLERIEARIGTLASKTERFRMLRRQYQSYLQRISRVKPPEKRDNYTPQIIIDPPRDKYTLDINKNLSEREDTSSNVSKTNDEKIEILDKYLQTLSSQKCKQTVLGNTEKDPYSDLKYLSAVAKKYDKEFDSNKANSIAEDIMTSIYSRHYKKDLTNGDESLKANNFTTDISNASVKSVKFPPDVYKKNGLPSSNLDRSSLQKAEMDEDSYAVHKRDSLTERDAGVRYFNNDTSTSYMDREAREKDSFNTKYASNNVDKNISLKKDSFNKNPLLYSPAKYFTEYENEKNPKYESIVLNKARGSLKNYENDPLGNNTNTVVTTNVSPLHKPSIDSTYNDKNGSIKANNADKIKRSSIETDDSNDPCLSKAEIDVAENEKCDNANKNDSVDELCNIDDEKVAKEMESTDKIQGDTQLENYNDMKAGTIDIVGTTHKDGEDVTNRKEIKQDQIKTTSEEIINHYTESPKEEQANDASHLTVLSEINVLEEQSYESELKTNQKDGTTRLDDENQSTVEQEYNTFKSQDDVDQLQDNINTDMNVYNQDNPYNQYEQPVEYDQYGNQIIYDEKGEPIQPQYEDIQYDQNEQVYDQSGHYDDGEQLVQQQYDENGSPNVYDQQYTDTNQSDQFYRENGQVIHQYDENGQVLNPYDEQYMENSQPMHQYDQNGQIIEQYDENGQLVDMYNQQLQYDENGQPLIQYDENGQPIELYDQNQVGQEYEQGYQQYDENGQLIQQYDNTDAGPQYTEDDQQLIQQDGSGLENQEYIVTDPQFQAYDETAQQLNQSGDGGDLTQQYHESIQPPEQQENDCELKQDLQENAENNPDFERGNLEQSDKMKSETKAESESVAAEGKSDAGEENLNPHEKGKNVLEMLDTDTESMKQNTSKISNESDFDFSNS